MWELIPGSGVVFNYSLRRLAELAAEAARRGRLGAAEAAGRGLWTEAAARRGLWAVVGDAQSAEWRVVLGYSKE